MTYELWDLRNGNNLGSYATRAEAFQDVLTIARDHPDLVADLELHREDGDGRQLLRATGTELADLARQGRADGGTTRHDWA